MARLPGHTTHGDRRGDRRRRARFDALAVLSLATTGGTEPTRRGHLSINGLELSHEVYGDFGDASRVPLLRIPGAFLAIDSMAQWVARFVADRPVIDQEEHGRSPATPRPLSYAQFGDDAAAIFDALEVERAAVMAHSQGGGVALQLVLRHPHLVSKLVTLSATYRQDGWYPEVLQRPERDDR